MNHFRREINALIFYSSTRLESILNILEMSIIFYNLPEFTQIRPFLPKATSNFTHFPILYNKVDWMSWCLN